MNRFLPLGMAIGAIALLGLAGLGHRMDVLSVRPALQLAEGAVYLAIAAFTVAAVHIAKALTGKAPNRPRGASLFAIFFSLPMLILAAHWVQARQSYPAINDITTDSANPPTFTAFGSTGLYPGASFSSRQARAYPDIRPLHLPDDKAVAFALALSLVHQRGWQVAAENESLGRIEAVAESFLFGFEDEIVLRIRDSSAGSVIDMRSRSRVGKHDYGANAKRIRSFMRDLRPEEP